VQGHELGVLHERIEAADRDMYEAGQSVQETQPEQVKPGEAKQGIE
jgi:hypothetical protein